MERAQRAADIEHELDNMLLHGAIAATDQYEQSRVIGALSFKDRNFGKDEIEATEPFPGGTQPKGSGPVHLRYIDDAKSAADSYTVPVHQDQHCSQETNGPVHEPPEKRSKTGH